MRFYKIIIKRKKGDDMEVFIPPSMKGFLKDASYTSIMGSHDRPLYSALDVFLNIPVTTLSQPRQGAMIRINGISLDDIAQFTNLVEGEIEVYAGMLDGYLPLAKRHKPELLMRGTIYWATGNWEGTNTTLELAVVPLLGLDPLLRKRKVKNLAFDWDTGTLLEPAIRKTLEASYGRSATNPTGYEIAIHISDKLKAFQPMPGGPYPHLSALATAIKRYTKDKYPEIETIDKSPYDGVEIIVVNKTIKVFDNTKEESARHPLSKPLEIQFYEIIGQPTWKTQFRMQFKTVMRGDIDILDWVKLPSKMRSPYVTTTVGVGQAPNDEEGIKQPSKDKMAFSGAFEIIEILHVGQFRQASAASWVTVFDALPKGNRRDTPPTPEEPLSTEPKPKTGPRATIPPPTRENAPFVLFPPQPPLNPTPPANPTLPPFVVVPPFPR